MSSTAALIHDSEFGGSLPQIRDLGIPLNSSMFCLPFRPLPAVSLACKICVKSDSRKEAERASRRGKRKNEVKPIKLKIMHSRIFQVWTEPIDKENYLNEDTLNQGDDSFYDYCANINDEERKEDIACLVNDILPKGMFELVGDDTMRYNGGLEQWKEEYVANIHKRANALTVENMLEWRSTYYLKRAITNPLDTEYHFYLDGSGCQSFAEQSFAFMQFVCSLEPGTILYIGGVIDYHF